MNKIRVLIAEDHSIVRSGIVRILRACEDIEIVGEAYNGEVAVDLAIERRPDVILMDVDMPGGGGVEATRIITNSTSIRVLMLTGHPEFIVDSIKAGALGYLLKESSPEEMVTAIRKTAHGIGFLDPGVHHQVINVMKNESHRSPSPAESNPLSKRERQILRLVAMYNSNKEIANELCITEGSVKQHLNRILAKLGADKRMKAVSIAQQQKWI